MHYRLFLFFLLGLFFARFFHFLLFIFEHHNALFDQEGDLPLFSLRVYVGDAIDIFNSIDDVSESVLRSVGGEEARLSLVRVVEWAHMRRSFDNFFAAFFFYA